MVRQGPRIDLVSFNKMRSIFKDMRTAPTALAPLFRSAAQGEILAAVLLAPAPVTVNDVSEATGRPYSTVYREFKEIANTGIITLSTVGRTIVAEPDRESRLTAALTEVAALTYGPPPVIAEALSGVRGVEKVFIYGSWAARRAGKPGKEPNDIDVLVVGDADRFEVADAVRDVSRLLAREVNPTVVTASEWASPDRFLRTVAGRDMFEVLLPHIRPRADATES